ncbi:uncharacterized protein BDR25DRAFT_55775 [Lindgomyces ingoldianus]|uniref:Uncharacterized protein n=1 Tax=Lindgomyces ingoldianus TaxID=673940 RepID=A0ACB6QNR7_9PLEO|nr:uncharacterized protein BDR25DRAFT_55775 [Lindgomyces ingoldianus]KAF2468551.1 hypothetical protein BDR25DRAFT_55775 [Lindgomyces ingoldianus]
MRLHLRGMGVHYKTTFIVILCQSLTTVFAQQHSSPPNEGLRAASSIESMLQHAPVKQQAILSQALGLIHSMQSSPTCHRLAGLTLVNDCQSFKDAHTDTSSSSEAVLEEVKSAYAARLAICELRGAKAVIPRECEILVPSSRACVKHRFSSFFSRQERPTAEVCYPDASRAQFDRCLRALESKPQWWTSYSNARQNAVVMCYASRSGIERDEKLSLYESLAEVALDIESSLAKSAQEAQARLNEQLEFVEKIRMSEILALQDIRASREATHSIFDQLKNMLQSFKDMLVETSTSSEALAKNLNVSDASVEKARTDLQSLFTEVAEATSQHVATHTQNHNLAMSILQMHHEMVLAIQLNHEQLNTLTQAVGNLRDDVDQSAKQAKEIQDIHGDITQHVSRLNGTFKTLETTAGNLQSAIDATTETIQLLSTFGGLASNPKLWGGALLFLLGLWFASRRIAGIFMALAGLSCLLYSIGIYEWLGSVLTLNTDIHSIAWFAITSFITDRPPLLWISLGLAGICPLSIVVWSYVDAAYMYKYEDEQGAKGVLPSIETPEYPATPQPQRRHGFDPFRTVRSMF